MNGNRLSTPHRLFSFLESSLVFLKRDTNGNIISEVFFFKKKLSILMKFFKI